MSGGGPGSLVCGRSLVWVQWYRKVGGEGALGRGCGGAGVPSGLPGSVPLHVLSPRPGG